MLWHFVLNQSPNETQTLSGEFDTYGAFGPIAPYKVLDTFVLHYYFITGDPDTLTVCVDQWWSRWVEPAAVARLPWHATTGRP